MQILEMKKIEKPLVLRPHNYPGALISFAGIDGSGKTTIIKVATDYLVSQGVACSHTFTPTKEIRSNSIFRKQVDKSSNQTRHEVDFLGLCLLIFGDLLQHIKQCIIPELEQGKVVLCDRYIFTSAAEIRARSSEAAFSKICRDIAEWVLKPDLSILIDVAPEIAEARLLQREEERHKILNKELIQQQRDAYLYVAKNNGLVVISAEQKVDHVFKKVQPVLDAFINERNYGKK